MKTKTKFGAMVTIGLIFLNTLIIIGNATAQTRGSVWVHGLNSQGSDWSKWEQLFLQERRMTIGNPEPFATGTIPPPQTYNTSQGVSIAAQNVRFSYLGDNRTILFGHSMGGVVGRHVDVNYPNSFGGIVTFGSPLDGARIANSAVNGQADAFLNNGVDRITRGPIRQTGALAYIIWGLWVEDIVQTYIRNEVKKLYLLGQDSKDLEEGSLYMQSGIRNSQTGTPKIHVYGNEESPVLWRFVSSGNERRNGRPGYNDTFFVDVASIAGDVYETAMWVNYGLAVATGIFTFGIGTGYYVWVADGWMDGKNWWRYDSEAGWNNLIGAYTPATRTVCYTYVDNYLFMNCYRDYELFHILDQIEQCNALATVSTCYTYQSQVNGQSDGFIKAPSQTGYNSDWSNNATLIEARGVNHIEMLDNDKIRIIMNSIFDRTTPGVDPFFKTDPR
jgi:hypothetical protein